MNQSISEELGTVVEERIEKCFLAPVSSPDGIPVTKVNPDTLKYIVQELLSQALTEDRKELRERVGKKRHYDLEEFDHESKLMSVGFNQAIDQVLSLLEEK